MRASWPCAEKYSWNGVSSGSRGAGKDSLRDRRVVPSREVAVSRFSVCHPIKYERTYRRHVLKESAKRVFSSIVCEAARSAVSDLNSLVLLQLTSDIQNRLRGRLCAVHLAKRGISSHLPRLTCVEVAHHVGGHRNSLVIKRLNLAIRYPGFDVTLGGPCFPNSRWVRLERFCCGGNWTC
jgi:hypothetical protein